MPRTPATFPSIYVDRTCVRPPVWTPYPGIGVSVLQCADGVGSSKQLGCVARSFNGRSFLATVTVTGTRECQGAFAVCVGRFEDRADAVAAVERGVELRHADRATFDAAARLADRHDETLSLDALSQAEAA